ncbi:MAG: box helicase protein [Actinomycetota bacterium]|nr:box helicase protein [Actinomycetota bacterium]
MAAHPIGTLGSMAVGTEGPLTGHAGTPSGADHFTDARAALDELAADPELLGRCVHREVLAERPARYAEPANRLHPEVAARLVARGIPQLYAHQTAAIDALHDQRSVVVATGTASGKSLCYQVPIVSSVVADRRDTALLLFPTKALAQDQLRSLRSWLVPGMRAVTYDGDTANDDRAWARKNANVVLTNPEMLHMGILPSHKRWATFLMRLQYVVVDELHTLRGIFGSHVAHVLRRLRRLCEHYGSSPTFFFASATIGNPGELASALCGLDVDQIDDDGSPRAERVLACWQRPLLDAHSGARGSANVETAELMTRFVRSNHQTLAFTRSRRGAEVVAQYARRRLAGVAPELVDRVAAYRAGYLPEERRALELDLASGRLLGIAATNALELGIDIGGLDAVVLNGFPGTLASMWQQAGRAGRTGRRSAAVLVAGDDQLDQWYAAHPTELTRRAPERAVVNPQNPFIVRAQVACAANEMPLTPDDERWFGAALDDAVRDLVHADLLTPRAGSMYWSGGRAPARGVGLRSGSSIEYRLLDLESERTIGTVDDARVFSVAHPGAVYLHQGRQYRVDRLDRDEHLAILEPYDEADEYTQARTTTDITIVSEDTFAALGAAIVHLGTVEVRSQVVAFQRKQISTNSVIEVRELELPERALVTRACWYTMPPEVLEAAGVGTSEVIGAVHAAEHGLIGMLPLFTICDRWDVGGVSMALHPQTMQPTIFVYDGYPGGAGIAELAFDAAARHARATLDLITACSCDDGCPSCVQSPKCGNWNEYLDKRAATALLGVMTTDLQELSPGARPAR